MEVAMEGPHAPLHLVPVQPGLGEAAVRTSESALRHATPWLDPKELDTLHRLTRLLELRSPEIGGHIRRVARISFLIAQKLDLSPQGARIIEEAAPLHDIGKALIPDRILEKKGCLTAEEQKVMRQHTTLASQILSGGTSLVMTTTEKIGRSHHERWDGQGYPDGLKEAEIPLPARIVALADAFDAMKHDRPYRAALARPVIRERLLCERGRQFDPEVVDALFVALQALPQTDLLCEGTLNWPQAPEGSSLSSTGVH